MKVSIISTHHLTTEHVARLTPFLIPGEHWGADVFMEYNVFCVFLSKDKNRKENNYTAVHLQVTFL